jgi:hypothetical protein
MTRIYACFDYTDTLGAAIRAVGPGYSSGRYSSISYGVTRVW